MIEGLKIELSSDQLREHIAQRAEYHANKARWYSSQIQSLRAGGLRPESVTNDPVQSLEHSLKEHQDKAAFFTFLAEHVIPNETYRLDERDLGRLEILSRYF